MHKISYALGLGIGQQLRSMNIEGFCLEDFVESVGDVMNGRQTQMGAREAQEMLNDYFTKKQRKDKEEEIRRGADFLRQNGKRAGVTTTKSGLQYEVMSEGTGRSPKATDRVRCHYEGRLTDGTVFDSSRQRGEPADFGLNQVITGWTEGVQLMREGAKYRFFIPYMLGYGESGAGSQIPPYATLVFDVELIKVL